MWHENTKATFAIIAARNKAQYIFNELVRMHGIDFRSNSGSNYIVVEDIVYRYSNHWGRVSSCSWILDKDLPRWMHNEWILASCPLANFQHKHKQ